MWPFNYKKVCRHHRVIHDFKDLHRGADGELYFRHYTTCVTCGERWCFAPRIPDAITEVIDSSLWAGTLEKKEPRHD